METKGGKRVFGDFSGNNYLRELQQDLRKNYSHSMLDLIKKILDIIEQLCAAIEHQELNDFYQRCESVFDHMLTVGTELSGNHEQYSDELKRRLSTSFTTIYTELEKLAANIQHFVGSLQLRSETGTTQDELLERWQQWFTVFPKGDLEMLESRVKESKETIKNALGRQRGASVGRNSRKQIANSKREKILQLQAELDREQMPRQKQASAIVERMVERLNTPISDRHVRRILNERSVKQ
jgi:molecular chaperone GrpE (heat shock protein)